MGGLKRAKVGVRELPKEVKNASWDVANNRTRAV